MTKIQNILIPAPDNGNKTPFHVNLALIQDAINRGYIDDLAFYYRLKLIYPRSFIKNYRSDKKKIAARLDVSIPTVFRRINRLIKLNLCYKKADNIVLATKLRKYGKCTIELWPGISQAEIKILLYGKIFEAHSKLQSKKLAIIAFALSEKQGKGNRHKLKAEIIPGRYVASYRYYAKLIKVSLSTAYYIIQQLNKLGIIATVKQKPEFIFKIPGSVSLESFSDYPGYKFIKNGSLYVCPASVHTLLMHKIKTKPVTLKRYRKAMKNPIMRSLINEKTRENEKEYNFKRA